MSRRPALFAAAALMASSPFPAKAADVQRIDITAQLTGLRSPYAVQTGQLVSGEISPGDYVAGPDWNGDVLTLNARAGQLVTAQLKSDIPSVELHVHSAKSHTGKALIEGPATASRLSFVAPKDGAYLIFVHAKGPARFGRYLLSLGSSEGAPSFDPPKPLAPPVKVAEAPPQPAAPPVPPPLPSISGVINIRAGQTQSRPAGQPGAALDMFQFMAAAGSELRVSAIGAGRLALRLYTGGGEEMVTATGEETIRVKAVAPMDNVYFVTALRGDPATPYHLGVTVTEVGPPSP